MVPVQAARFVARALGVSRHRLRLHRDYRGYVGVIWGLHRGLYRDYRDSIGL